MKRSLLWSQVTVYSAAHALVDAACAAALFSIVALGRLEPQALFELVLLYNVLAFSLQPVFGLLVDRYEIPAWTAVLGIALVAAATLATPLPLLMAVLAGLGNALFHVGGGVVSLNLVPGRAALPGVYVAPGALGLTLGILIGRGGNFTAWPFLLLLLLAAAAILALPRVALAPPRAMPASLRWFEAVLLLLLLSVAIRSMVGLSLVLPWKSEPRLLLILTLAVVLGKALGGVLGDRFGWAAVAVSGLALSIPLLAFGAPFPALAIAGSFLFNLSMPITLIGVSEMLPGRSGFAFGLTTLALILGAFPTFTPLRDAIGRPGIVLLCISLSALALYAGLHLFAAHFHRRLPDGPAQTQPEVEDRSGN